MCTGCMKKFKVAMLCHLLGMMLIACMLRLKTSGQMMWYLVTYDVDNLHTTIEN
jgi:hypothetical protein